MLMMYVENKHRVCLLTFLVINLLSFSLCNGLNTQNTLSPVILVPGDGGCQIDAKWEKPATVGYLCAKTEKNWANLWLTISDLTPYFIYCLIDNMWLIYNSTSRTTSNSPGVETRIPGFGETSTVEYLDPFYPTHYFSGYFISIVDGLVGHGYERKKTIKGAPFDFRKAPNELKDYMENLSHLISNTSQEAGQKVTLIAHSMGAPLLHLFLTKQTQQWKDKYIQAVISLSGAWGGSIKPIKVYAVGDNLGYRFLSASAVKLLQRSLPSLAFLMPSRELWDMEEVLVQTPAANYSLSNLEDYFKALQFRDGFEMYQDTKDLLFNAPPPGVEIHCLHGLGVPTTNKLVYNTDKDFPANPNLIAGDGDGTVNKKSAESCLRFARKQKQMIYHKTYDKVDHMGILSDANVLQYITDYLMKVQVQNKRQNKKTIGKKFWQTIPKAEMTFDNRIG